MYAVRIRFSKVVMSLSRIDLVGLGGVGTKLRPFPSAIFSTGERVTLDRLVMYCSLDSANLVSGLGGIAPGLELWREVLVLAEYRDFLQDWWNLRLVMVVGWVWQCVSRLGEVILLNSLLRGSLTVAIVSFLRLCGPEKDLWVCHWLVACSLVPLPLPVSRPRGREGVEEGGCCQFLPWVQEVACNPRPCRFRCPHYMPADALRLMVIFLLGELEEDSGGLFVCGFPGLQKRRPVLEATMGMGRPRRAPDKGGKIALFGSLC